MHADITVSDAHIENNVFFEGSFNNTGGKSIRKSARIIVEKMKYTHNTTFLLFNIFIFGRF